MNIILIVVAVVSLALAAIMSFVAWRVVRDERRRSEARVAALALDIHDGPEPFGPFDPSARSGSSRARSRDDKLRVDLSFADGRGAEAPSNRGGNEIPPGESLAAFSTSSSDLFAVGQSGASSRPRLAVVMALGIFVAGSAAALTVVLSSGSHPVSNPGNPANLANPANPVNLANTSNQTPVPLELHALVHERNADRLTVRGLVRNPPAGGNLSRLTAVVLAFDNAGGLIASGRALVAAAALAAGAESPFVVTVPGAADVGRYRVSFRTDNAVVPHVDRRPPGAMAQLK